MNVINLPKTPAIPTILENATLDEITDGLVLEGSRITGTLAGITSKGLSIDSSILEGAEFGHCKMTSVDFRGSDISKLSGVTGLKGAKIDTSQLITISQIMAVELGIIVG